MRLKLLCLAAAWICLGLTGCPEADKTKRAGGTAELPFSGQSIHLAVPEGFGFRPLWEGPLTEWQAQTGAKAELTEYDPIKSGEPISKLAVERRATLAVFPLSRLGDLIDADALVPIPQGTLDDLEGVNWLDLYPGLRERLSSPRKQGSIVPLSCPVLVCYYRRDLLEKAGLAPPQSWSDYQKLLDSLGNWAPEQTAVEPWGPDFRATMFLARSLAFAQHAGNYSLFFDMNSGAPLIGGPGFVRGLEVAQRAWGKLSPDFKELTPTECRRRVLTGQAALAIAFEPEVGGAGTTEGESRALDRQNEQARIGICRLPGSAEMYDPSRRAWDKPADRALNQVTLIGFAGWGCAVMKPASARDNDAAWNAVSRLGGLGFLSSFPTALVGLCRESQGSGGLDSTTSGWRGDEAALCVAAIAQSLRDSRQVLEIPVPRQQEFLAALAAGVSSVLEDQAKPAEALKNTSDKWQRLVKEIGAERLKNCYRAALGLSTSSAPAQ